jgi:hypothetical protein
MRAIRRMVPTKPPPIYITISDNSSDASSKHAAHHPVGALAHIATCAARTCAFAPTLHGTRRRSAPACNNSLQMQCHLKNPNARQSAVLARRAE